MTMFHWWMFAIKSRPSFLFFSLWSQHNWAPVLRRFDAISTECEFCFTLASKRAPNPGKCWLLFQIVPSQREVELKHPLARGENLISFLRRTHRRHSNMKIPINQVTACSVESGHRHTRQRSEHPSPIASSWICSTSSWSSETDFAQKSQDNPKTPSSTRSKGGNVCRIPSRLVYWTKIRNTAMAMAPTYMAPKIIVTIPLKFIFLDTPISSLRIIDEPNSSVVTWSQNVQPSCKYAQANARLTLTAPPSGLRSGKLVPRNH